MKRNIPLLIVFLMSFVGQLNAQLTSKGDPTGGPGFGTVFEYKTSDNVPANSECYCHFYSQHNEYLGYVASAIDILLWYEVEQWMNGQKELLKEKIEDRMGQEFSDFNTAQRFFFKETFGKPYAEMALGNARSIDESARTQEARLFRESYVPRKIFQYAQSNNLDFGDLTRYNKRIEDMSFSEAQNHFNYYATINIDHQVDWRFHNNRIFKNDRVKEEGTLADYIAQQFINHVNSQALRDQVELMTAYLIYDWQNEPLVNVPEYFFGSSVSFYYPYQYQTFLFNYRDHLINTHPEYTTADLSNPDWTDHEMMGIYSMRAENLGTLTSNFYKDRDLLTEKAIDYQSRDDFSYSSKNMLKRLAEYFVNDEPFMLNGYWNGLQSWGQDDDRPERLMNVRFNSQTLNYGMYDFGRVLEALGGYGDIQALKGALIREYLEANLPSNVDISGFSDADLGLLFDFDWRGFEYLGLRFSDYANSLILVLEQGDNQYAWDYLIDPIKVEMLLAILNGETVSYGDMELMTGFFEVKQAFPDAKFEHFLEFIDMVEANPYALINIDCDQIQYWQALVQHVAPPDVQNKINNLPSGWMNDFEIQPIDDATGTVLNLDYFSVKVDQLPINQATNAEFLPWEFLTFIRQNINDFVEGSTFEPYCEFGSMCATETALWNSNNPGGNIVYINIAQDDGVVVVSEHSAAHWNFMTMNAPVAGNHPVSGTRQFGYEQNADGSYTFYTRGADRIASIGTQRAAYWLTTGPSIFSGPDQLWSSFQQKISQYVNNFGGSASVNAPLTNRFLWEDIRDVLTGNKPISDFGCD